MVSTILSIVLGILTCAIGLWKYFTGKEKKRQDALDEAGSMVTKGVKDEDISAITAGFDRIIRLRRK